MRRRYWSFLVVLALLNYIVLVSLFSVVSEELSVSPGAPGTRTPCPTFTATLMPQPTAPPTPTATRVIALPPTPYTQLAHGRMMHVVQPGEESAGHREPLRCPQRCHPALKWYNRPERVAVGSVAGHSQHLR